ncbi:DUF5655 domain-containing protein [uncultured Ruthenibacterium sp.]|uniref:DUF5655 domain-containing protein n=1 Tax=uncultured Ruthenibacterium sp. TaxID=1905347 RepID=UPI00349E48B1
MMELPEHYWQDVLFFFENHPFELELYRAFTDNLEKLLPETRVKVQKAQISFYGRHLFACACIPIRRKKEWPEHCLMVSLGLSHPLNSSRVAVSVQPYPGRWTHHFLITHASQFDAEWNQWLYEAWQFSETK